MTTEADGMIAVDETAGNAMTGTHAVTAKKIVMQTILGTVSAKVAETVMEEIAIDVATETLVETVEIAIDVVTETLAELGIVTMKTAMIEAIETETPDVTETDATEILDEIAIMAVTEMMGATTRTRVVTVMTETIGTTVVPGLIAIAAGIMTTMMIMGGTAGVAIGTTTAATTAATTAGGAMLMMRTGGMRAGTAGMQAAVKKQMTSFRTAAARPSNRAPVPLLLGTSLTSTQHQPHQSRQTQHRTAALIGGPLLAPHQHQHLRQPQLPAGTCWTWTHAVSMPHLCKPLLRWQLTQQRLQA